VATPVDATWISNATWLRWDLWDANNGSCSKSGNDTQSECSTAGTCSIWSKKSKSSCLSNGGTWTPATWTPANHTTWNGCVSDRDKDPAVDYDTNDTAPTTAASNFPAWQCFNGSLQPVMGLSMNWGTPTSNDVTTLHGKVNAMTPTGYTNINIGLVWGWHMLSPTALYTDGAAYGTANLTKYIVLMTDGNNTRSRYAQCPATGPCAAIDDRMALTCTNIKNAAIKIYTIRLVDGNADLLRNCATSPSMYYDVQDASQLSSVFNAIGAEIASLHLMK
jgi:hypothetical protein